jgi:hypothetical protein
MANDHGRTSQVSDNDAEELLPAADGGDHRAEQAFRVSVPVRLTRTRPRRADG